MRRSARLKGLSVQCIFFFILLNFFLNQYSTTAHPSRAPYVTASSRWQSKPSACSPSALCLLQAASMGRSAPAAAASAGAAGERGPAPQDREHGLRGGQRVAGPARRRRDGRGRARAAAALPVHDQRVPHRRGAAGAPA